MSSTNWNNFLNNMPGTLNKLSMLAIGMDMLNSRCCMPLLFPFGGGYSMNFSQYPIYPQASIYQSPMSPPHVGNKLSQYISNNAVSNDYSKNLGQNLVNGTETNFVSDKWSRLNDKSGKNSAEEIALRLKYRGFVGHLGKSLTAYLDNSALGNKDGYVSREEFLKFVNSLGQDKDNSALKAKADKIFANIDLSKDGKLDWKELSAFLAMADNTGEDGQFDGKIKSNELLKAFSDICENSTESQNKLKDNYNNLFNIRF